MWSITEAMAKAGRPYGTDLGNTLKVRKEYIPLFVGGLTRCIPDEQTEVPMPYEKWTGPKNRVHIRDTVAALSRANDLPLVQFLPVAEHSARESGNTIVLNPVSAKDHKHWNVNYWTAVAKYCLDRGYSVFVNTPEPITGLTDLDRFKVSYGMPDIQWLAIMLRDAAAVVSVDSGPMHLADAVGNAPVAIFTSTSSISYGPYNDRRFVVDGLTPLLTEKDPTYTAPASNTVVHRQAVDAWKRVQPQEVIAALEKRLLLNAVGTSS